MHLLSLLQFHFQYIRCPIFVELQLFPNMIRLNIYIYFFDVVKMVIIDKNISTFSYGQVV